MKATLKKTKELVFYSTDAFVTKRHPKGDIFFLVKGKKRLLYDENGLWLFELILTLVIVDTPKEIEDVKKSRLDKWELSINRGIGESRPMANFHSSLFLHPHLQSCGIGSVMFNLLLREGWTYFSEAEAQLTIKEDANKENTLRKEKFYNQFGIAIEYDQSGYANGYAKIKSFDDLYVYSSFEKITKLDLADVFIAKFKNFNELNVEMSNLSYANENLLKSAREYQNKYYELKGRLTKCIMGIIFMVLLYVLLIRV